MDIDDENKFSPSRPKDNDLKYSDHKAILIEFANILLKKVKVKNTKVIKESIWNTNRQGGWKRYRCLTEDNDQFKSIAQNEVYDLEDAYSKFSKVHDKIKFKSFRKVRYIKKNIENTNEKVAKLYKEK